MGEDPLRTGAIFAVDPNHPALRSPVPRLHGHGPAGTFSSPELCVCFWMTATVCLCVSVSGVCGYYSDCPACLSICPVCLSCLPV
eukprot:COSAG02_NODE_15481_length_1167_cov_1.109551_1_plen_84_part_10